MKARASTFAPKDSKLPISPMANSGAVQYIPLSKITTGEIRKKSFSISNAVVAYLDILGFSQKKNQRDIKHCLLDFAGPLTVTLDKNPNLRGTVFSDCAFMSASEDNAADLLSSLRYAFKSWTADGVLVRGGMAIGKYNETQTHYLDKVRKNFISRLFYGSAVTSAVRVEELGQGALLFANEECARFYQQTFGEPIYSLGDKKIIGWSDEPNTLYWFAGVSFVRILRLLSLKGREIHSAITNLLNNVRYSLTVDPDTTSFVIAVILSSPIASNGIRSKVRASLGIDIPEDSALWRTAGDWLKEHRANFAMLVAISDMDSSITSRFWKNHRANRKS